jgi:hypothetical protein
MVAFSATAAEWKPAAGPLLTRWAKDVSPENALPEYPRPQMVRSEWMNLNGLWDYAIRPKAEEKPAAFDGPILVPFPVESALSGVMKKVRPEQRLWYHRSFELPKGWEGKRVLLHFGAVDWETQVWVNGTRLGEHRGGYDPFTLDATEAVKPGQVQEIVLAVFDPTSAGTQPRGKQVLDPGGIWYTPTTGIWRTVWLEAVPQTYIQSLKIVPDVDAGLVRVTATLAGDAAGLQVSLAATADGKAIGEKSGKAGEAIELPIKQARLWTPDTPFLYDLKVQVRKGDNVVDEVTSYFGMRKIALGKDTAGITRILLNNKFVFQYGPLDQGFWPDGLYTAPTDEALRYDIEITKKLGCNMARKHVKVEPDRWYYWCDKLGLLVWQDMPSGDRYIGGQDPDIKRTEQSAKQFEAEFKAVIDAYGNHPSIIMWVPFNEGWGQFDTPRIVAWTKQYDPSRLVNNASGWTDRGVGDVNDIHSYPGPAIPKLEEKRAVVLGEFGGLGLPVKGHTWQDEKNWGYRSFANREALTDAYVGLLQRLHPLVGQGLSAAVYTQTTDVEVEVNGLLTYDRAMIKMDQERIAKAAQRLYLPPPKIKTIVPTSEQQAQTWRFTTETPGKSWPQPTFDDAKWKSAPAGFGRENTPGAVVRTPWTGSDIWIRREVTLPAGKLFEPCLRIHHDEDAEVYLNGVPAATLSGYTTEYATVPISPKAAATLKEGKNTIAVHCRQTGGGQYIDVGIADMVPAKSNGKESPAK